VLPLSSSFDRRLRRLILAALVVCCALAHGQVPGGAPAGPVAAPAGGTPGSAQTSTGAQAAGRPGQTQTANQQNNPQDRNNNRTGREDDRRDVPQNIVIDQPTEFQRLVSESTGSQLTIFGASLFGGVPSTFAPVEDIPVGADYVIGPGDTLRVNIFGQLNRQLTLTVDRTGNIDVPDIGSVHVAGLPYTDLRGFLKNQLGRVFRNFDLTVNLSDLRSIQVFVVGEARRPGAFTVSSLSTLLNALFVSGGPLPQGSLRDIRLMRGGQTLVHFDLYDLLLHGDKSKDMPLEPGDVIFIPPVGEQVAISGSVTTPAIYEIKPGTTVAQLVGLAGGTTQVALGTRIRIERIYQHTMRYLQDVDPKQEGSIELANGDVVTIGAILDRYRDSVTLRGNVSYPGRYVWHPGMHITDVVPSRDVLVTRDYYRRRNALGSPQTGFTTGGTGGDLQVGGNSAAQQSDSAVQSGATAAVTTTSGGSSVGSALTASNNVFPAQTDVLLSAPDIDWSYAVIERLDAKTLKTNLIPFNPGRLYLEGDKSQDLELLSGDVVAFFSTADLKVPTSQQTRFVRLEGEFAASGVYSVDPGETLRHLLIRVGGFTPDAYLYGSEFTRQSTKRVQQQRLNEYADNLEAQVSVFATSSNSTAVSDRDVSAANSAVAEARQAINRLRLIQPQGRIVLELKPDSRGVEAVPDLPLEDGDRFVVPRVPSTVTVEGQVYSANAFVFERGLKEETYLRKAGGPDRQADRKRIFILRADGSVYSRQYGDVAHATIFPGDTVVVPPQYNRLALLRNLVDISTVVGQFGLGAAAVNVLK
jgi:protein involved in polysaccharide export with SLBB domain